MSYQRLFFFSQHNDKHVKKGYLCSLMFPLLLFWILFTYNATSFFEPTFFSFLVLVRNQEVNIRLYMTSLLPFECIWRRATADLQILRQSTNPKNLLNTFYFMQPKVITNLFSILFICYNRMQPRLAFHPLITVGDTLPS